MTNRILFIATSSISLRSGGGLANRALYYALEERYPGKVDVVMQEDGEKYPNNFFIMKRASLLLRIIRTVTCRIGINYNDFVFNLIDKSNKKYSHCIINSGSFGKMIPVLHQKGLKVCTVHHNYEPEFALDNRQPNTFWGMTSKFVIENERIAYRESDTNLFLTESDMRKFKEVYGPISKGRDYVIGIFDSEHHDRRSDETALPRNRLVICGSLCSVQTVAGIKSFEKMCLPVMHDYYKDDFALTLTGRAPGEYIQNLVASDNNLSLVPSPQDISSVVYQSGIFICPTNVGGGLKLRILDGLKLGLPIIAHEISARGYDKFFDKEWFQIYNDTDSFQTALIKVNKLIKERKNLRQEILDCYYSIFSFDEGKCDYIKNVEDFLKL